MLANIAAGHDHILLVLPVDDLVHPLDEQPFFVLCQEGIPFLAPDHLTHIPTGTPENTFQFLNDFAVAPHGSVQPLQVAVDDKDEVVESLAGRQRNSAERFGFVALAVADEAPNVLLAGVFDAAILQILIEPRLIDGHQRPQAHRHRWKLPELGHEPRVRIARQPASFGQLATKILQLLF